MRPTTNSTLINLQHYAYCCFLIVFIGSGILLIVYSKHFFSFADQTPEEIERTKQFALEVIDLLKHSPQSRIPFNR